MSVRSNWFEFFHIDDELHAIRALLDGADVVIARMTLTASDRHIFDALVAPGLERLFKISFGFVVNEDSGSWPAPQIKAFNHRLIETHESNIELFRNNLHRATNAKVVNRAIAAVEGDPLASTMLRRAQEYACNSRYDNFSALGGAAVSAVPSSIVFDEAHAAAVKEVGYDVDDVEARRNALIRESLARIRAMYFYGWAQGIGGDLGRQHSSTVIGFRPPPL